jgi:putative hemolysin
MHGAMLARSDDAAATMAADPRGRPASDALLGRIGSLVVRIARDRDEMEAAQRLRYRVFHEELGATGGRAARDADDHDEACDHLLVIDEAIGTALPGGIVGTYRLLRQDVAVASGGFYSSAEFEIEALVARHPDLGFLELGRSCVLPAYRSKRTIELLWQGIWAYVRGHGIDAMFGCASFQGTVPAAHASALTWLAHHHRAEGEWAVRAVAGRHREMDLLPIEGIQPRAALAAMPPLVKGYLRLGASIGEGCVVDEDFGTTDVLVVLPVSAICSRYVAHYGADAQRFAA